MPGREDEYLVPSAPLQAELRERGSRFVAILAKAGSATEAREFRRRLAVEYSDASHHCWAERIGWPPAERWSDAGEPRGTAGEPMVRILRARQLSDVVAVVVRWFGGTKLGKGGLARAYSGAVAAALENAPLERRYPSVTIRVRAPYERLGAVKRLLRPGEVELIEEDYGAVVEAGLRVRSAAADSLLGALADLRVEVVSESEDHS